MRLTSSFARLKHSQVDEREREESSVSVIYLDFIGICIRNANSQINQSRKSATTIRFLYRINHVKHFVEINNQVKYMANRFRIV